MMTGKVENVSPAQARRNLDGQIDNRNLSKGRIAGMVADRQANRWRLTHQGLAFDCGGRMIDGQHRMHMVIQTGMATKFFVVRGVALQGMAHIDEMRPRQVAQALRMGGLGEYGSATVTTMQAFVNLPGTMAGRIEYLTRERYAELLKQHKAALTFSCENLKAAKRGITRATRALVARAWYHSPHGRLAEFCEVLRTGKPVTQYENDAAGMEYAAYIVEMSLGGMVGHQHEVSRYKIGQSLLRAFLEGRNMTIRRETSTDLYPLPEGQAS